MATEYDLKLIVDADTTEARRKLDELAAANRSPEVQEAGRRVQEQTLGPRDERRSDPRPQPPVPPERPAPRPQPPAPPAPPERPQPRPQPPAPPAPPERPQPRPQPPAPPAPPERPAPRPQPPAPPERPQPRPQPPAPPAPPERPAPRPQPPAPPSPPASKPDDDKQLPSSDWRRPLPKPVMTPEEWEKFHREEVAAIDRKYESDQKQNADEFGRKAGETAGKAIGRAVAGFVSRQVLGTAFAALKTPGGDNRALNVAEQGINGGIMGGMAGYELGKGKGAAIGATLAATLGVASEVVRQMHAVTARENAMRFLDQNRNRGVVLGASDSAFGKQLDLAGGFRQREELLRARRQELTYGDGAWSVKNLTRKVKYYDPESDAGKNVLAQLNMQKDRIAALNSQLVDLGFERAAAPGRMDPSGVADAFSARGIQVGAQVDVAQVNEKIMDEVAECRALLQKIAEMGVDRPSTITDVQLAVFE